VTLGKVTLGTERGDRQRVCLPAARQQVLRGLARSISCLSTYGRARGGVPRHERKRRAVRDASHFLSRRDVPEAHLLHCIEKRFRGGLVFKARRLLYHSTLGRE